MGESVGFQVGEVLSTAVVGSLERFANGVGLPPLDWKVRRTPEGMVVVEGRPRRERDITAFPRWARLLRLDDYGFELQGGKVWSVDDGTWCVRIVSGDPAAS